MENLLQFIVNGLLIGGVYALGAMSLAIIYKSTQVFNFAVGEFMVLGMYITWSLMQTGIPAWACILLGILFTILVGWISERWALRPLLGQPVMASIMATFALMFILRAIILFFWQGLQQAYPVPLPGENIKVGHIVMSLEMVWIFIMAMVTVAIVFFIYQRTKIGLGMRAAAEDQQLAQVRGTPVGFMFSITWMIAAAVCGVAGIFVAYRLGISTDNASIGLAAFPAVLLGGIESIPGL